MLIYNLDAVIAVGYRVNSYEATQFRRWASAVLKEYIVKGYVLDDERLIGKSRVRKHRRRLGVNMRSIVGFKTRHFCQISINFYKNLIELPCISYLNNIKY